ncbi:MAG: C4-dicarboxylate ABC transporter permease, partial [Rhizobiaceae bacterium]|nr:C4-dicarboxylate ABC transporter permease [Rhizobiaceae bacterium]
FGFALFYLRGVAPATVKTLQMYKGVIAFIGLQLSALVIVGLYPSLVNYLPNRALLLSETAPPPRAPQLQYCVENYVGQEFAENGDKIMAAIKTAQGLDLKALPKDLAKDFTKGTEEAAKAPELLQAVFTAEQAVKDASGDYRPLHTETRAIQRQMRVIDTRIKGFENDLKRIRNDSANAEERRAAVNERIAEAEAEKAALEATISPDWAEANKSFLALLKDETNARNTYRRTVDNAYEPVTILLSTLRGNGAFTELGEPLKELIPRIGQGDDHEAMIDEIKAMEDRFGDIEGPGEVKKALSKARRALKNRNPDPEKAADEAQKALLAFNDEVDWRSEASSQNLIADIEAYEAEISGTIGLRQAENMPREVGLFVASCNSGHRDISLNF